MLSMGKTEFREYARKKDLFGTTFAVRDKKHCRISEVLPDWEKAGMSETSGLVYWLHSGSATAGRCWITGMCGR